MEKLQELGVSEQKAGKLLGTLTQNEDGTYSAQDVSELKEKMAAL